MFNKLWATLALCLIVLMSFAQQKLTVRVLDKSGASANGATVAIDGQAKSTNQDGIAVFDNLNNQFYNLKISFIGYKSEISRINPVNQANFSIQLKDQVLQFEEVYVSATRAKENSATTYKTITKEDINKNNLGQDIPYLLDQTPGVVIGSDAGAGIGYTSMTIRGSDSERINVTLNGIPLNNPESMGSFFVNLPDFASSTESIQIQRGIGTSTNGPSAFGASLNIQTDALETKPYLELNNSFGSYNSWKNTIKAGSGLINNKFAFNARLSRISSDGYVERASSNLKSMYVDAGLYTDKHSLKATVFSGKEKTYQAWYGVAEPLFKENGYRIEEYAENLWLSGTERDRFLNGNRKYNYYNYDNQTDNYTQTHAHLNYSYRQSEKMIFNTALHYTRGAGYYEEFKPMDNLEHYGIAPVQSDGKPIEDTDLIRRRWLDNHFYGLTYSLLYKPSTNLNFTFGGAYNQYKGDHYGEVIWANLVPQSQIKDKYYFSHANKNDFNFYAKADYRMDNFLFNLDVQYRNNIYNGKGDDDKIKDFSFEDNHNFVNPKAGITYFLNNNSNIYASYAFASKEPTRNDYVENPIGAFPKTEKMQDIETGYRFRNEFLTIGANAYAMLYKDQLIPTGALNDVGSAVRINVDNSYRMGLEMDASWRIHPKFTWSATAALSQNRIKNFIENIPIYDDNFEVDKYEKITHKLTEIAKSPSTVLSNNFTYKPIESLSFSFLTKYISRIYLDNTNEVKRSIDPSFVNNFQAIYSFSIFGVKNIDLNLMVNNIFNEKYATSGFTYSSIMQSVGKRDYFNFYYPQAETNAMLGLNIRF
ncbi:TonB-dependent receptor [Sphingobacterium cellulitidis]|uniref:TonB-dependent receptor n=1 Tax=Sphingobacterium cellulitidis TaxID=1768011 RepID=A0A8H9G292_9SPHI|nr:TonB-dependent receptor [Sphingobacterium soli]MBA8987348.1 iron complex outermembrane receptor protein [Sphingobacterium soli]GGE30832.1 TonB-dependent receptor [Sphingobacterium soli]